MNKRCFSFLSTLGLSIFVACTPAQNVEEGNSSGGSSGTGGKTTDGSGGQTSSGGGSGGSSSGGSPGTSGGTSGSQGGSGGSTGGTSGSTGGTSGTGGSTGGTGGSGVDASPEGGGGTPSGTPGSALHDQVFKVPCANPETAGGDCGVGKAGYGADNGRSFTKEFDFGGDPTKTYKLTFKMCAVFEFHLYNTCAAGSPNDAEICVDGKLDTTSSHPTYPTLAMKVSEPMHTYYLNKRGMRDTLFKYDYMATVEVKGGAKVTIESDGGNNGGIYTAKKIMASCPTVPGIATQPFGGQFAHFQVVSVEPK